MTVAEDKPLKLDDLLACMKQIEEMFLQHVPASVQEWLGRDASLRLARSVEGRSIGGTRVLLPPGHERTGEMFLIQGDKLIHIPKRDDR